MTQYDSYCYGAHDYKILEKKLNEKKMRSTVTLMFGLFENKL